MTGAEQWLGGAALVGVLAAFWNKIKVLTWRLANLLIVRARVEGDVGTALGYYCWSELKRSPFGEKRYCSINEFVQPVDRYQVVGYESVGTDPIIFWRGWRPILLNQATQGLDGGGNNGLSTTVTFIRGMFNLDSLLTQAIDRLNETKHSGENGSRYYVKRCFGFGARRLEKGSGSRGYGSDSPDRIDDKDVLNNPDRRYLKWQRQEIGMPRGSADAFSSLAFPPEVLEAVNRCRRWLASAKWYKEKEIAWRLGLLLYGRPGTGKSSLVKAIGRELNLPVYSYDLASFSNQDFEQEWQRMINSTPCIALLEDVDAVFDGRQNRLGEEGGGLTFDCLLNCIGGIKDANGVLVFITTNRPECLDDALGKQDGDRGVSTRPGRIDMVVELGVLTETCRKQLAERILVDCSDKIDTIVQQGDGDTGAQFVERCSKIALEHYWGEQGPKVETNGVVPRHMVDTYDHLLSLKKQQEGRLQYWGSR